jgi:hypothetical protein
MVEGFLIRTPTDFERAFGSDVGAWSGCFSREAFHGAERAVWISRSRHEASVKHAVSPDVSLAPFGRSVRRR